MSDKNEHNFDAFVSFFFNSSNNFLMDFRHAICRYWTQNSIILNYPWKTAVHSFIHQPVLKHCMIMLMLPGNTRKPLVTDATKFNLIFSSKEKKEKQSIEELELRSV